MPTIIVTSKNNDSMVLAKASVIEFASLSLDSMSPALPVSKKVIGNLNKCLMYGESIFIEYVFTNKIKKYFCK
ncbi:hypothetical protein JPSP40_23560 [Staphylococcus pseudintermedius]